MRLKYHSLIALGISSIILNGCASSGGGFLNLGVVDALKKSKACLFKQKLGYTTTPLANTGLSLPTFGTKPTLSSGPVMIDNYAVPQATSSAPTSDCGCNAGSSIVDSSQYSEKYYMPIRTDLTPQIVEPPIDAVPSPLMEDAELPSINPLPSETLDSDSGKGFDSLDTEGSFDPLGQTDSTEFDSPDSETAESDDREQVVDGQKSKDQSIFEAAKLKESKTMKFDEATDPTHAGHSVVDQKPTMLTLHARPAQSHNVFDKAAQQQKSIETMQASHKRNFRQQNALRPKGMEFNDRGYRQAMNTDQAIEFKPLPPVKENKPAPAVTPETKLAPLPALKENTHKMQNGRTRTAAVSPRVPILRATTASSASILSLKNLANVIQDTQRPQQQYDADHRTAQGSTTSSVEVLQDGETTIER